MKDAFGGAFMIQLLIVFIIIYVGFTAVALNYAKAFKAKNAVIEYLEDHEISDINMTAQAETEMIDYFNSEIVGNLNYVHPTDNMPDSGRCSEAQVKCYQDIGIMIEQIEPKDPTKRNKLGTYYRVTTYFGYDLPFINTLYKVSDGSSGQRIFGNWKIVGETRPIAYE